MRGRFPAKPVRTVSPLLAGPMRLLYPPPPLAMGDGSAGDDLMVALRESLLPVLPDDGTAGALAGRVWRPDVDGPAVVAIRADGVFDVSATFPTMRDLWEEADPAAALRATAGMHLGALDAILANTPPDSRDTSRPWLLAPIDLQAIKAAGVTFPVSMLERVIEERARGNPDVVLILGQQQGFLIGDDRVVEQAFLFVRDAQLQIVLREQCLQAQARGFDRRCRGLRSVDVCFDGAPHLAPQVGLPARRERQRIEVGRMGGVWLAGSKPEARCVGVASGARC